MAKSIWTETKINNENYFLLDLDHPEVEDAILSEIDSGVDVYYDRRWGVTEAFCNYLFSHPEKLKDKTVLIIGAGVGMETLAIGRLCKKLYINDMAPIALKLCSDQLKKNGVQDFEVMPGSYVDLEIPQVDMVVGCFLVYNSETLKAMNQFFKVCKNPIMLMDESSKYFEKLVSTTNKYTRVLFSEGIFQCILFE